MCYNIITYCDVGNYTKEDNASLCCLKKLVVLQKGDNDEPTVLNGFQSQSDKRIPAHVCFYNLCTTSVHNPCKNLTRPESMRKPKHQPSESTRNPC